MNRKCGVWQRWPQFCIALLCAGFILAGILPMKALALEEPKIIKVESFPYDGQFEKEAYRTYSGYGYDYLKKIARYTGWRCEFVTATWEKSHANKQITPLYGFSSDASMEVSNQANPMLLSVLHKGIRNISVTETNRIVLRRLKEGNEDGMAAYLYLHPFEALFVVIAIFLALLMALTVLLILRWKSARKIKKAFYTDSLTGYSNYKALSSEAPGLIGQAPQRYALIYLDIHRFKVINDTFGYEAGDKVLIAASNAFRDFIEPDERFARIYADTFVLLLRHTTEEQLRSRLDTLSLRLERLSFEQSDSIKPLFCGGVYLLPPDFENLDKACDRANYAKDSILHHFSNTFVFYNDVMRSRILAEKELESSMTTALEHEEFVPFYQPKVNAITGKVVGAEALVRWMHPEKGCLPPGDFLPFYEKNGFIVKIDLSIFEQVCRDLRQWLEQGNQAIPVSVNFSRRHIRDGNLPQKLYEIVNRYGVPASLLEVEVTETEELENVDTAVHFVNSLKAYGFGVSIDDYGTGYSSISFLQQLPLDALKLDRVFILNAMKTGKAKDVMRYLVTAMQKNVIRIICEGIETNEQKDFVISLNCRFIQGYLYSMPLPREQFEAYLLDRGTETTGRFAFLPIINFEKSGWSGTEDFLTSVMPSWVASCYIEPGYPICYISPSFLEGTGYSKLELQIATDNFYLNWVHPDDRPGVLELMEEHKNPLQELTLQYRLRKKDGSYLWIREVNKRVLTEDGRPAMLSVCTDVSDIVALQTEKSQLVETIPGGVGKLLLGYKELVILSATDRFYQVIGYSQAEMEKLDNNLLGIIGAQDLQKFTQTFQQAEQANMVFCQCTIRVRRPDESLHWVTFHGSLPLASGERFAIVIAYNSDREMEDKQATEVSKAKLELALDMAKQAVFEYDIATQTVYSHKGFSQFGISDHTAIYIPDLYHKDSQVHPEDGEKIKNLQEKLVAGIQHESCEIRVRTVFSLPDSPYTWLRITLSSIYDEDKRPVKAVGILENISKQKRFEYAFLQEAQFRKTFTESSLMAYEINLSKDTIQRITGSRGFRLQELCETLHSFSYSFILPTAAKVLVSQASQERFMKETSREQLLQLYQEGIYEKELEYQRLTLDGKELWNSLLIHLLLDQLSGDIIGYAYHRDIQKRKEMENGLIDQANRDPLTGVYNRTAAQNLVEEFLASQTEQDALHAFFMFDLNRFKEFNDTYGHYMGDQYLVKLGQVISEHLREGDIFGRIGGDEFFAFIKNLSGERQALDIASAIAEDATKIGTELHVPLQTSVSIGAAFYPRQGTDFDALYRLSDDAMYKVKNGGAILPQTGGADWDGPL